MRYKLFSVVLAVILGSITAVYASPALKKPDPAWAMLEKMQQSLSSTNYRGVFVYLSDQSLSSFKVFHLRHHKKYRERLVALTGDPHEVYIEKKKIFYLNPLAKQGLILIHSGYSSRHHTRFDVLKRQPYYQAIILGVHRVAGLRCDMVALKATDHWRYGRRYCLWTGNGFPLETEVVGNHGKILETMLFTSFKLIGNTDRDSVIPKLKDYRLQVIQIKASKRFPNLILKSLPPGYKLDSNRVRDIGLSKKPVHQMIFSDGMTVVSAFISPPLGKSDTADKAEYGQRGDLNIYRHIKAGRMITVMGVAPAKTIKKIYESIQLPQS